VKGNILNPQNLLRLPLGVDLDRLDPVQGVPAVNDLAEDGVLAVQLRLRGEADEELRAVGAGALVGHADDATGVVAQGWADLVREGLTPDGGRGLGLWVVGGGASLEDEGGHDAVERGAVVFAGGAEGEEVLLYLASAFAAQMADLCGFRHRLTKDFDFDVADVSVKLSISRA